MKHNVFATLVLMKADDICLWDDVSVFKAQGETTTCSSCFTFARACVFVKRVKRLYWLLTY